MADDWFKLNMDIFGNRKIKFLRRLPDGDSVALFWIVLLAEARRCNSDGKIFLTESIPYTPDMLAEDFCFEKNTVELALDTFEQLDMTYIDNGFITITGWEDHQNAEGLARIREQTRKRVAKHRESKKDSQCSVTGNVTVTQCNATEEDKDKDIEEDIEVYISIVDYLNQRAGTKYRCSSKKTKSCIHARLQEGFTIDDFKTVIDKKADEWMGTDYEQYLRPETLFGTKFESYLNAKIRKQAPIQTQSNKRPGGNVFLDMLEDEGMV